MDNFLPLFNVFSGILVAFLIICVYIIRNLLIKVEKYEDSVESLQSKIENIDSLIKESSTHIRSLDSRGIYEADDELGYFFKQLVKVQDELDSLKQENAES